MASPGPTPKAFRQRKRADVPDEVRTLCFVPTYWAKLAAGTFNGAPIAHIHGGELTEGAMDDVFQKRASETSSLQLGAHGEGHLVSSQPANPQDLTVLAESREDRAIEHQHSLRESDAPPNWHGKPHPQIVRRHLRAKAQVGALVLRSSQLSNEDLAQLGKNDAIALGHRGVS